jgi:hypothetical protein
MITRDNLPDLINMLTSSERQSIIDSDSEYTRLDVSFFNAGTVVSMKLINDLPDSYDEDLSTGHIAYLDTREVINLLT